MDLQTFRQKLTEIAECQFQLFRELDAIGVELKNLEYERMELWGAFLAGRESDATNEEVVLPAQSAPEPEPVEPAAQASATATRPPVPLPLGSSIPDEDLIELKDEIRRMDPYAFREQGIPFIRRVYPELANTPAWHEINVAMQQHFKKRRQQIAGVAARIARHNGEEHIAAQVK
ncbi:MAG: hypothetical protein UY76_C0064G0005 [Candidatus Uhrbacteria bacterium GW2011_GWA2_52_8d]|uniref:Uncharacterized protein n=1 Tax=Candidatus Uhrbacteria bacterium GW2011_GWA2_52_8d TaxID=1618979 RepID=A0A0G1XJV9_9BACT|nr:MAG: hypothetical protein UY76_C0064G0005 [Candidatus Uhrbacteria bacterium GW2011_GWA2_52_8d]